MARGCFDCERSYGPGAECRCVDLDTECVQCERAYGPGASCHCVLDAVAQELGDHDIDATVEYPGALHINCETGLYVAGTANGPWGVDYYAPEHAATMDAPAGTFETAVPGDCENAYLIAQALTQEIAAFEVRRRSQRSTP